MELPAQTVHPWRARGVAIADIALLLVVAIFVYLTTWGPFVPDVGASLSGVWWLVVTLPTSAILLLAPVPDPASEWPTFAAVAVAVLPGILQATIVYTICSRLDRRRRPRPSSP